MATSTIPSRISSRPRPVQENDVDLLDQDERTGYMVLLVLEGAPP